MEIEIPLSLTPQQAAVGVGLSVDLPSGDQAHVDIPPGVRDGEVLRLTTASGPVRLLISVPGGPATAPMPVPGPAAPGQKSGAVGAIVALCLVGAVMAAVILAGGDEGDEDPSAGPSYGSSYDPSPTDEPSYGSSYTPTDEPTEDDTDDSSSYPDPDPTTEAPPDPYTTGTCLNGSLPTSDGPQSVSDVDEVPCSASDAHYKVIQTFPFTSDMNRCRDNPRTQYAFSSRYTINGATINEYVYCLVGLGSYAR
ncbi:MULTISPECIES: LppU/SCO3897 family protein [Streptomyces]|uniref:PASTA domain-containing protein n=1 Tax=Streptomyces solicathayae TaxID=3081768 RepID=A0ABZ0LWF5_9ACTN|nr:hypothetical protein [Streptomyces sp. HUAS YS2]WOX23802.1 hypothetical protein R2D22_21415 [Streptomyces sp. HUAS YS2]